MNDFMKKCHLRRLQSNALLLYSLYDSRPKRRFWVHDLNLEREEKSEFLLAEEILQGKDEEKCFQYLRMSRDQFYFILDLIEPDIRKKDTHWRLAIPAKQRLIVTLRYLATGSSQVHLAFSFRLGHSTVGKIIKETMNAIWQNLSPLVLSPPDEEKWLQISRDFYEIWQCPNCVGALDGKHVRIRAPARSGSEFFNYKGYFSIVLLAVCDAHYRFTLVDIGNSGRHSDGGVFLNSKIGKLFDAQQLNIPSSQVLPNAGTCIPMYFAADDAFPLKTGMMKPYPGLSLDPSQKIFNYRLCRARRVIENAFGILCARWQVFNRSLNCEPNVADLTVQAAVVLHNYLQMPRSRQNLIFGDKAVQNGGFADGSWRIIMASNSSMLPMQQMGSNFSSRNARQYRDQLKDYFMSSGSVSWQWNELQLQH